MWDQRRAPFKKAPPGLSSTRCYTPSRRTAQLRKVGGLEKSPFETTSKVLQNSWKQLSAYSIDQDSQVIRDEAAVPGGASLGTALGDHWAVALPFSEAHNPIFDAAVDRNVFPRTALLEAMVRFVINDLETNHRH
jgi:hypothetical protein